MAAAFVALSLRQTPARFLVMTYEAHPLRSAVIGEVHARPFAALSPPRRVLHFAFMCDEDMAVKDREAFSNYCELHGKRGPEALAKFHKIDLANGSLRWEQHAEFTTYSWGFPVESESPFATPASSFQHLMQGIPQPGPHLVSVDLYYAGEAANGNWQDTFDEASLTACRILDGRALAATDFRVTSDGFVRYLLLGENIAPLRAGSVILQLLELETYRSLCLLGLPLARKLQPRIREFEQALANITSEMVSASGLEGNRALLGRLMTLAGEIEASSSKTQYRFAASWAYYQIVRARIEDLGEMPVGDLPTFSRLMERRIAPAVRTCGSTEDRQERIADKLARAANLLRTRVDIELEQQNADILKAMSDRSHQQLRLQQTVEGLSIAAISYYVVQLLFQLSAPLPLAEHISEKSLKALLVIVSVAAVAFVVRRIRKQHSAN
jgi:uncharacterized membrane-anchored protein